MHYVTIIVSVFYFMHMVCMLNAQQHSNFVFNLLCASTGIISVCAFTASIGMIYSVNFNGVYTCCLACFMLSELLRALYLWGAGVKICSILSDAEKTKTLNLR